MVKYFWGGLCVLGALVLIYISFDTHTGDATEQALYEAMQEATTNFDVYKMKRVNADIAKYCLKMTGQSYGPLYKDCESKILNRGPSQ